MLGYISTGRTKKNAASGLFYRTQTRGIRHSGSLDSNGTSPSTTRCRRPRQPRNSTSYSPTSIYLTPSMTKQTNNSHRFPQYDVPAAWNGKLPSTIRCRLSNYLVICTDLHIYIYIIMGKQIYLHTCISYQEAMTNTKESTNPETSSRPSTHLHLIFRSKRTKKTKKKR